MCRPRIGGNRRQDPRQDLFQRRGVAVAVHVFAAVGRVVSELPVLRCDLEGAPFDGVQLGLVDLDVVLSQELHFQEDLFGFAVQQLRDRGLAPHLEFPLDVDGHAALGDLAHQVAFRVIEKPPQRHLVVTTIVFEREVRHPFDLDAIRGVAVVIGADVEVHALRLS